MEYQEFCKIEQARATAFNVFSALLCQPEEDLITETSIFKTLSSAYEILDPDHIEYISEMEKALKKYSVKELLVEYSKLFIGPFKLVAPPYSAVYFGTGDTLMSDETLWVINFYNECGLQFDVKVKNMPDHIAVETEFLYYLVYNEIKELQSNHRKKSHNLWKHQSKFYNKHYRNWVPEFCEKVINGTENEYYKALSVCLNGFVNSIKIPPFPEKVEIKN